MAPEGLISFKVLTRLNLRTRFGVSLEVICFIATHTETLIVRWQVQ